VIRADTRAGSGASLPPFSVLGVHYERSNTLGRRCFGVEARAGYIAFGRIMSKENSSGSTSEGASGTPPFERGRLSERHTASRREPKTAGTSFLDGDQESRGSWRERLQDHLTSSRARLHENRDRRFGVESPVGGGFGRPAFRIRPVVCRTTAARSCCMTDGCGHLAARGGTPNIFGPFSTRPPTAFTPRGNAARW